MVESLSADLTRFDFHVNRFLDSEDVQQMSAEEVGQYILLLCEAWRLHKGASLPNNQSYLTRIARGPVSPNVMKKFSLVTLDMENGLEDRLRNKRLYEEWQKAINRYRKFSNNARRTNEKRWSESPSESLIDSSIDSSGESPSQCLSTAIPYHTNPNHSIPNQKDFAEIERAGKERRLAELEKLRKGRDDEY
jgi:uncharacterized protein YdaU (DUF1376 family)